jgi:hypothetical protein
MNDNNQINMESPQLLARDGNVNPVIELMANMLNYLNVSLYEGQFTLNHEQSRRRLNEIYDIVSITPCINPSLNDVVDFYRNVKNLRSVTETDDPDYCSYMRELYQHVRLSESRNLQKQRDDITESIRMKKKGGV